MSWTIGVDVGGTFTDFFACDSASDKVILHKVASTPHSPCRAITAGLDDLAQRFDIDITGLARLSHGTTVATNALIERRGGRGYAG